MIKGSNQTPMAKLIKHQSHWDRQELTMMPRDRLSGGIRTTPAVQVHNLIQQSIRGGPMSNESGSRKSRNSRWKARKRWRKQTARSKNTKVLRVQSTLAGENLVAKDSDSFGHKFPLQPTINSSIITFQNTGQMKQFIMSWKSEQIAKAFKKSNASVALYAEHSLNQKS